MEIRLNVMVDITPRVENLAERMISVLLSISDAERAPRSGLPTPVESSALTPKWTPGLNGAAPEPVQTSAPEPVTPKTEKPAPAAADSQAPVPDPGPEDAVPDDETMRTMMDIAISRVCGTNGWQESQDSRVIDLRRSCTNCFREISRHLGADRPTGLQGELRNRFLSELENIYVDEGQRKAVWRAF